MIDEQGAHVTRQSTSVPSTAVKGVWALSRWAVGPLLTIIVASFVIFAGLAASPGDPVAALVGSHPTPRAIAIARAQLGLNKPLYLQYWWWLTGALHGEFGTSITYRMHVSTLIASRIPTTLFLVVYAAILVVVFGIGFGILGGGIRRLGPGIAGLSAIGVGIPNFVFAGILVAIFALHYGWFPTFGAGSGFLGRLWHMTLPAIALAIGPAAYIAQVTRAAIFEEASSERVDAARGRGLSQTDVFRRHVLRNSLAPMVTVSALTVAGLISGAVVVENCFGIGGLGSLLLSSVTSKDYPVVEAVTLILLIIFVVTTALIDVVHKLLDPRLRRLVRE